VPVSGEIHVRDYVPRDENAPVSKRNGNGHELQTDEGFAEIA
jgi:hypothetical protein